MIRDQLAEHATHPKMCEKLIMSPDYLTLRKALEIALQIDKATELTSQLASRGFSQPALTQLVEDCERSPSPASSDTDPGINYAARTRSQPRRSCGNCGSSSHMSRAPTCPARGKVCQCCGRENHFAKVCRSAPSVLGQWTGPRQAGASSSAPTPIHSVSSARVSFKTCTVELDGVCVP